MRITRQQLNKLLEGIATAHYQIHTYGWGDVPDLLAREDIIYPFMMVTPQASVYGINTIDHTYTISIADRVLKDKENEVAVDSDTHEILMHVVTQLDNLLYDDVDLIKGVSVTPFFDNFRHEVTGHFANVTVQVMYNYDACAVPSDNVPLPIPPPSDCADGAVTITDSDGATLYVVNVTSGGAETQAIGDSSVEVRNSLNAVVDSGVVKAQGSGVFNAPDATFSINSVAVRTAPSNGSASIQVRRNSGSVQVGSLQGQHWRVGDSTVNVRKSDATLIQAVTVAAEDTESVNVADSVAVLKDTAANVISSTNIKATESEDITAPDGSLQNSDASATLTVRSGEVNKAIADINIEVNTVVEGTIPALKDVKILITDGVNPVTPDDVSVVGDTVTVEVPSGGAVMNVDFSADKVVADLGETITFTDLTDNSPTHWSWRFDSEGESIAQNPKEMFLTAGFKDITLLAGKTGAGGVEVKSAYIEVVSAYWSDVYGMPAAAYSLRKLTPNATNCIRVRRSSDNTEQDIGFVASAPNAIVDTAAIASFIGTGSGFVTKWYDQSTNGRDAAQTTAARQPLIAVLGGNILREGKYPIVRTTAAGTIRFLDTGWSSDQALPITMIQVGKWYTFPSNGFNGIAFSIGGAGGFSRYEFSAVGSSGLNSNAVRRSTTTPESLTTLNNYSPYYVKQATFAGTQINGRENGNVPTPLTLTLTPLTSNQNFALFSTALTANFTADLGLQETIFYSADKLTELEAMETYINKFYNVF